MERTLKRSAFAAAAFLVWTSPTRAEGPTGPCSKSGTLDHDKLSEEQVEAVAGLEENPLSWNEESDGWVVRIKGGGTSPAEPADIERARREFCKKQGENAASSAAEDEKAAAALQEYLKRPDARVTDAVAEQYDAVQSGSASQARKDEIRRLYNEGLTKAAAERMAAGKPYDESLALFRGDDDQKSAFLQAAKAQSVLLKEKRLAAPKAPSLPTATPFDGSSGAPAAPPPKPGCSGWCGMYSSMGCGDLPPGQGTCDNLRRNIAAHGCSCP